MDQSFNLARGEGNDSNLATSECIAFLKKLQTVKSQIHSTNEIDEIMLDLSQEICDLFSCDRLTIYILSDDKTSIETKVKTGLHSFKNFRLSISENSIAGYTALSKKILNLRNVYDQIEVRSHCPRLQFFDQIDVHTGYRAKEMLTAPLIKRGENTLEGVIQLINNRKGGAFSNMVEEGIRELSETIAIAFEQRSKAPFIIRTKYDPLVAEAILSAPELTLAVRSARRKNVDIEDILIGEFQVNISDIGESLARFFGVPYEPCSINKAIPIKALKKIKREYAVQYQFLPFEESMNKLVLLTTNPERAKTSPIVSELFHEYRIDYRVTTKREFRQMVDHFFDMISISASAEDVRKCTLDLSISAENRLIDRVNAAISFAFQQDGMKDIRIALRPGIERMVSQFRKDGSLEKICGQSIIDFQMDFPSTE